MDKRVTQMAFGQPARHFLKPNFVLLELNFIYKILFATEIITKVANPENPQMPYRPEITETDLDSNYRRINLEYLIHRCWAEEVNQRPTMKAILRTLNKINPFKYGFQ